MADLVATSGHDLYVFDMPPFGHGVRMIAMAGILSKWVGKITEAREKAQEYEAVAATLKGTKVSEDEVLKELQDIQAKITRFTDLMVDQRRTSFFMVLIRSAWRSWTRSARSKCSTPLAFRWRG